MKKVNEEKIKTLFGGSIFDNKEEESKDINNIEFADVF